MKKNFLEPKKVSFSFSPQLKILFQIILANNGQLRLVGGCVRDFLSKHPIADIDLACNLLPEVTTKILVENRIKVVATGIKYGTVTAIVNDQHFQITTLRKDTKTFGRDCEVEFVDDFYLDALRRDFTINAMSIDFAGNLYDYFGGEGDLKNKIVRFIGDANTRINEDYLRILRFWRFSAYYGDDIDADGRMACVKYKNQLGKISKERIKDEFFKILNCPRRKNLSTVLQAMQDNGILPSIFNHDLSIVKNLFALEEILDCKFKPLLVLAAITLDEDLSLNLSNDEKQYLLAITKPKFTIDFQAPPKDLLKLLLEFDRQLIIDVLTIKLISAQGMQIFIDDFHRISKIIMNSLIPDFPVNGHDLIAVGIKPQSIGKLLKIAQEYWWKNNFLPGKKQIVDFILHKTN